MAIHVSDRTLSRMQYEDSFRQIRNEIRQRTERTPKRRRAYTARPLLEAINDAFEVILGIEEDPEHGTKHAPAVRYARIVEAQKQIKKIEKPLWVYWNICGDEDERGMKEWQTRQRGNLADRFNAVLQILHDMQKGSSRYDAEGDVGRTTMRYFTEEEIEKAEYLRTIRALHRMTHGKAIRLNAAARDAEAGLLIRLMDTAWYMAAAGNQMHPDRPGEAETRRTALRAALSALNKAQRPLAGLLSIGSYSNREMEEWIHLYNESVRLLAAVIASDRKRSA